MRHLRENSNAGIWQAPLVRLQSEGAVSDLQCARQEDYQSRIEEFRCAQLKQSNQAAMLIASAPVIFEELQHERATKERLLEALRDTQAVSAKLRDIAVKLGRHEYVMQLHEIAGAIYDIPQQAIAEATKGGMKCKSQS